LHSKPKRSIRVFYSIVTAKIETKETATVGSISNVESDSI